MAPARLLEYRIQLESVNNCVVTILAFNFSDPVPLFLHGTGSLQLQINSLPRV